MSNPTRGERDWPKHAANTSCACSTPFSLFVSPNLLTHKIIDAIPQARDLDRTESEYHWKEYIKYPLFHEKHEIL